MMHFRVPPSLHQEIVEEAAVRDLTIAQFLRDTVSVGVRKARAATEKHRQEKASAKKAASEQRSKRQATARA